MQLPPWADPELSNELPKLRAKGEGQGIEFKQEFPQQAHTLGESVAAFATSGGGIILIGVHKNGSIAGLHAQDENERDEHVRRAQGIVRTVSPPVNYDIGLACDEGQLILVLKILKQDEPVFYYQYRPYIRDGRISRPAEPEEVKERVWAHPSAEHKRRMEDLQYEQARNHVESIKSHSDTMNAMRRRYT